MKLPSAPYVDICKEPLKFVAGVARTFTFQGFRMHVVLNNTRNPRYLFGYVILDDNGEVIKYCRACNRDSLMRAVILN